MDNLFRTGVLLANMSGSTLCTVDIGGRFGRELSAKGAKEMVAFALDWVVARVPRWHGRAVVAATVLLGAAYAIARNHTLMWRWQHPGIEYMLFWAVVCLLVGFLP